MLDTIEAFIAETYVQLVATESMCYSTSCSALAEAYWNCLYWLAGRLTELYALYCAVPYIAACVDVSGTVFRDRSFLTRAAISQIDYLCCVMYHAQESKSHTSSDKLNRYTSKLLSIVPILLKRL